jgi:hypothetical protein
MMKIRSKADLQDAITELERKRISQELALKDEWADTYESLKPLNIIKNSFRGILSSGDTKSNLIGSAIGLGSGLLSKKLLIGPSTNLFKKTLGAAVQFGIAGLIAKNAETIKQKGSTIIHKIFSRKKKEKDYV